MKRCETDTGFMAYNSPPNSLEAKLVVLGCQGVGKTSLVHRYVKNAFIPPEKAQSTVGASFQTTTVHDPESGTNIRLQIWDTAGQERYRAISRLYYRGSHAAILCYDVTNKKSFDEMGVWLQEVRQNCGDIIIHVVGTKTDVLVADPQRREVPFEKCIEYVVEQLHPEMAQPGISMAAHAPASHGLPVPPLNSPISNRSSGYWAHESVFDSCHEISAKDGEGIEEVFRVITRKLVEQHHRKVEHEKMLENTSYTPGLPGHGGGGGVTSYFDLPKNGHGSFRVGHGNNRRSWMGFPTPGMLTSFSDDGVGGEEVGKEGKRGRCC